MPVVEIDLLNRFQGCLLGLTVGDALGARFESRPADAIRERYPTVASLVDSLPQELCYTDDTQMMMAVAETLIHRGEIIEGRLQAAFVANYDPSRGYGRGARAVLEAYEEGRDGRRVAEEYFPGGSYANGAAMRVAPVGLLFRYDHTRLREQARLSALPTHRHPLGIEGAQLLAVAVAHCSRASRFERTAFFSELLANCDSEQFREKLHKASEVRDASELSGLGHGVSALDSVPTAIASFSLAPDSFLQAIGQSILLGGDTDTIAAMTGALSGAYLGVQHVPNRLISRLERSAKGGGYITDLARGLYHISTASRPASNRERRLF